MFKKSRYNVNVVLSTDIFQLIKFSGGRNFDACLRINYGMLRKNGPVGSQQQYLRAGSPSFIESKRSQE